MWWIWAPNKEKQNQTKNFSCFLLIFCSSSDGLKTFLNGACSPSLVIRTLYQFCKLRSERQRRRSISAAVQSQISSLPLSQESPPTPCSSKASDCGSCLVSWGSGSCLCKVSVKTPLISCSSSLISCSLLTWNGLSIQHYCAVHKLKHLMEIKFWNSSSPNSLALKKFCCMHLYLSLLPSDIIKIDAGGWRVVKLRNNEVSEVLYCSSVPVLTIPICCLQVLYPYV